MSVPPPDRFLITNEGNCATKGCNGTGKAMAGGRGRKLCYDCWWARADEFLQTWIHGWTGKELKHALEQHRHADG